VKAKESPLYQVNEIGFEKEADKRGYGRVRNRERKLKSRNRKVFSRRWKPNGKENGRNRVLSGRFGKV
jgi:hypothetical protein